MWFFKKKEKLSGVSLRVANYKHYEDRFIVEVHKDENRYKIDVFDRWSSQFMSDEELKMEKLEHRVSIFDLDKNIDEITEAIKIEVAVESSKNKLRDNFTENWNKLTKPTKRKKSKKKVKKNV